MIFPGGGRRRAALVLTVLSILFVRSASAEDTKNQLQRGRQIYLEGTSPSGSAITAVMSDAGVEVPASAVPCGGCHGRDGKGNPEGGISPSDLTWTALTRPYGVTHPGGRKHPPYDAKLLKREVRPWAAAQLHLDPV